ncbi:MAG: FAD-dependent oxidoreductase, partial [Candidatus Limnocylindria bacterium]
MGSLLYDVAVVGAGIIGLATARELLVRDPSRRVIVLEAEAGPAVHQTGHNSGVIHSGLYYAPGSAKARLCVAGAALLISYCEERGVAYRRCGKVVVAITEEELSRLEELRRRGAANGLEGLAPLDGRGVTELEPAVRGLAGLHVPGTAIVDFRVVAAALAEDVRARGGA